MTGKSAASENEIVQVGDCTTCGYVVGEIDFPNTPTCDECGGELHKATVAKQSEVEHLAA